VFAKSSLTREVEVSGSPPLSVIHTEETGVAVRTVRGGRTGFASASGLETGAARTAVGAALALESGSPVDPLPPPRLLAASPVAEAAVLPARGWAQHTAGELAGELASSTGGRLRLLRTVVQEGSFAWLLATAEGFVVSHAGSRVGLLTELLVGGDRHAVWREWVHIPDPEHLDCSALAGQISDRALLTCSPAIADAGSRDALLHGEVAAHLLAALAPLFLALPGRRDPLPLLLDRDGRLAAPTLTVFDDRTSYRVPVVGPSDGEGMPTRRTLLLEDGIPRHRLASYRDALLSGESPRGGAVRLSYRDYPSSGFANLQVETLGGEPPANLLAHTDRALYLLRPLAPVEVDLAGDTYRLVASGVWLNRGRVRGWQPVVELRGRLGLLLRRVEAVGTDLAWYQTDAGFVGAPTLLARRQPVLG
jgi:PmbA protein